MSDKVRIAMIGTGFARTVQIPSFLAAGAVITSIASGSVDNARKAAAEFGIEHFSGDWREAITHDAVDLVCVTTPPDLHREMAIFALEHGKHVLCEKPMAMNAAEAEEMTAVAEARPDLLALIDHELRFQPGRLRAQRLIAAGAIGKIRHATWTFRAPHRGDATLPWTWWSDAGRGGGALGAIGSHVIDGMQWLVGSGISQVACQLQSHVKERPYNGSPRAVTTDDEANFLVRFAPSDLAPEATGSASVSMVEGPDHTNRVEIFGTEGTVRIEHRGDAFISVSGGSWTPIEAEMAPMVEGPADTGFSRGFMAFAPKIVEAIRSGASSIEHAATFRDGLQIQRVLDAARESDVSGRSVSV